MNGDRTPFIFGAWLVRVMRRLDGDYVFLRRDGRGAVVQWCGSHMPNLRLYLILFLVPLETRFGGNGRRVLSWG